MSLFEKTTFKVIPEKTQGTPSEKQIVIPKKETRNQSFANISYLCIVCVIN